MSWWRHPTSGYSSGPTRKHAMTYDEASETFEKGGWSRSRQEKVKVLPGSHTRLHQTETGFEVQYRDTGVVTIHPDGTYTLDHGGFPTKMTAQRMTEYAPVRVDTHGPRETATDRDEGFTFYTYDNLALYFRGSPEESEESLFSQFYPKRSRIFSVMEFPASTIRVDGYGRPVIVDLLGRIAPHTWKTELIGRLQAWASTGAPAHVYMPAQIEKIAREEWLDPVAAIPMQVRRTWFRNQPAAFLWLEPAHADRSDACPVPQNRHDVYRWVALGPPRRDPQTHRLIETRRVGSSIHLEQAVDDAEAAIQELGWSTAPPSLEQLLGYLSKGPPFAPVRKWYEREQDLPIRHAILDVPVMRVHWIEPWDTWEDSEPEDIFSVPTRIRLPRKPLPGSLPWPGLPPESGHVKYWFELIDGRAVAVVEVSPVYYARSWNERIPGRTDVLIHQPGS